jgi:hypothetical protein
MRLASLVAAVVLFTPSAGLAQFPPGVDDFEGGPTDLENWTQGANAPAPNLVNVAGGQTGRYMQITASGGAGPGSLLTVFNRNQWLGNYIAAGVTAVEMDLFAPATNPQPLTIRVAFKSGTSQFDSGYSSSNATAFTLPADGQWHHAVFPLTADAMSAFGAPAAFNTFMTNPAEMRILHATVPHVHGTSITAVVGVDNIRVVPIPEPAGVLAAAAVAVGLARVFVRRRRAGRVT